MAEAKTESKKNEVIDIEKLSFEDLLKLRTQVDEKFAEKKKAEKEKAIAEIQNKIKLFGIEAHELGFSTTTKVKRTKSATAHKAIAYKNEKGETWSGGRGPKPQWVKDILAKPNGEKELEKYKVQ